MIQIGIYITQEQLDFLEENSIQKSKFVREGINLRISEFKSKHSIIKNTLIEGLDQ